MDSLFALDIILSVCMILFSIVLLLACISLAWYVIWRTFLVKFKLIREIVEGLTGGGRSKRDNKKGQAKPKSRSPSSEEEELISGIHTTSTTKKKIRKAY